MANKDAPNGFRPIGTLDGSPWNASVRDYSVDAANAVAIFVGDAITLEADGNVTAAADGGIVLGVCVGIDVDGDVAATEYPGYLPATTAGTIKVVVGEDVLYSVQEDSVVSNLALTDRGANIDLIDGAGSVTTGNSGFEIDSDTVTSAGTAQFRIVDIDDTIDNEVGTNARWIVRIFESHWTTTNGI